MLSERQKEIITDKLKPLNPIKLGIGFYNEKTKELELLYTLQESKGYFKLMNAIAEIEESLDLKIDITSFDYLHSLDQGYLIKKENIFFNDQL